MLLGKVGGQAHAAGARIGAGLHRRHAGAMRSALRGLRKHVRAAKPGRARPALLITSERKPGKTEDAPCRNPIKRRKERISGNRE